MPHPLLQEYSGELTVIIHGIGQFAPDFRPEIIGGLSTLFDYVGHAYACLVTDLATRLGVYTEPDDWHVLRFCPEKRILEVAKVRPERDPYDGEILHDDTWPELN